MNSFAFELLVYLCDGLILGSLYLTFLKPKIEIWQTIVLWFEAIFLGMVFSSSFSVFRVILIAILEFCIIVFSFEEKFIKKLYSFLFIEAVSIVSSGISYLLTVIISGKVMPYFRICSNNNCTYIFVYLIILSVFASMAFQFSKKLKSIELKWVFGTQMVVGIGECLTICAFSRINNGVILTEDALVLGIAVVFLIIANLSVGIVSSILVEKYILNQGIDFGKKLSDMEYKYYEMSVENDNKIKSIRHEISNQIQVIYALLNNGQEQKSFDMINELKEKYANVETLTYCANPVINIILANKKVEAENQGIDFQFNITDFPMQLPISDFDLSTVICNLLDNAIRGCVCSYQTNPKLAFEITKKNKYLVVRILNSCLITMNIDSTDRIETTKSNTQTHGFGMSIVAKIVKKYKGDFLVSAKNGLFTATAVMSIK